MLGLPFTKYQPTWVWEREYDFTLFDKNVSEILNAVPDARLICFMELNPPPWWVRKGGMGERFDSFSVNVESKGPDTFLFCYES